MSSLISLCPWFTLSITRLVTTVQWCWILQKIATWGVLLSRNKPVFHFTISPVCRHFIETQKFKICHKLTNKTLWWPIRIKEFLARLLLRKVLKYLTIVRFKLKLMDFWLVPILSERIRQQVETIIRLVMRKMALILVNQERTNYLRKGLPSRSNLYLQREKKLKTCFYKKMRHF